MRKTLRIKGLISIIILFFLSGSITSGAISGSQLKIEDDFGGKNVYQTQDVGITCYVNGVSHSRSISYESGLSFRKLFSAVIEANAVDPCGDITRMLKVRFIEMLGDLGLIPQDFSVESVCSLIDPPWSRSGIKHKWNHLTTSLPLDDGDTATLFLCSMAGAGWGFVIPPFMLPRPRLLMQWRGFYPDSSAVSIAEMARGRGVIARGTQIGTAFGFIGIGFAFAFPGAPAQFGFLGYSLMSVLQGADMTWYFANFPPLVMQVSPENGAVEVPVSLSELRFTLKDYDFDKMSYSVVTSPDIGSGSDANVGNGEVSIPVSGLQGGTTYTWTVSVSDGTDTIEEMFSFTTEAVAPVVSNPIPAHGEKDVPMDITQLQFTLMDPQGDAMEYTVETSPNIGSQHEIGVHDGTFTVPVSSLTYGVTYHWFVNVSDGMHWTREFFSFETGYPSQFDPFEFGWSYRKQVTLNHSFIYETLIHFPVLVSMTDEDLSLKAQNDGGDILFMGSSGVSTKLYHDLESYTASSGTLVSWVDIPYVSSIEDTVFYLYYGNPSCINQEYPEKTWDLGYEAVWHMNDATSVLIPDSTSNGYTGTKRGPNEPQEISGKIGAGQQFDGMNDNIWINGQSVLGIGDKTISFWMKSDENNDFQTILTNAIGGTYKNAGLDMAVDYGMNMIVSIGNGDSANAYLVIVNNPIPDYTNYHYYTLRQTSANLSLYLDGSLYSWTTTTMGSESLPSHNMSIGRSHWNPPYCYWFDGRLDEIRMSSIARSSSWIQTEYYNQNSPSAFLTFGSEESGP